uniref:alkaline phosphatase n=1 Tax=Anopheles atroparvus TaxID=41427 RepID=A0A182JH65_ANOAO
MIGIVPFYGKQRIVTWYRKIAHVPPASRTLVSHHCYTRSVRSAHQLLKAVAHSLTTSFNNFTRAGSGYRRLEFYWGKQLGTYSETMRREEFNIDTVANPTEGTENDRQKLTNGFPRWKIDCVLSKLCIGLLIVVVLAIIFICVAFIISYENEEQLVATIELHTENLPPEQAIWFESNLAELRNAFRVSKNNRRAKNVALFVALDSEETGNAHHSPIWESFPHLALLRASQDRRAAFNPTALFCGIETRAGTLGLDSSVEPWGTCLSSEGHKAHEAASIVEWAQTVGRRTAVVTNGEIVHPFLAALYAHTPNESWTHTAPDSSRCDSIQTQLLVGDTGKHLNVVAGTLDCASPSCRELFHTAWEKQKMEDDLPYKVPSEVKDFLNTKDADEYVLGLYDRQALEKQGAFHDLTLGALHSLHGPEGFLLVAFADPAVKISSDELDATVRSTLGKLR